jgi:hypothetical protein
MPREIDIDPDMRYLDSVLYAEFKRGLISVIYNWSKKLIAGPSPREKQVSRHTN